jgi:hypothetical protein
MHLVDVAYHLWQDRNRMADPDRNFERYCPERIGEGCNSDGRVSRVSTGCDGQLRLILHRRHSGGGGSRSTGSQGWAAARRYFVPSSAK